MGGETEYPGRGVAELKDQGGEYSGVVYGGAAEGEEARYAPCT